MNTENARRTSTGESECERVCRCMISVFGMIGNALTIVALSSRPECSSRKTSWEKLKNQKCTKQRARFALPRTLFCSLLLNAENEVESGQEILKTEKRVPPVLAGRWALMHSLT